MALARAWVTASNVALLVLGVALDRLDQIRDEVVAALELDVDLRPGVLDPVPQLDQTVVGGQHVQADEDHEDDENDHERGHGRALRRDDSGNAHHTGRTSPTCADARRDFLFVCLD